MLPRPASRLFGSAGGGTCSAEGDDTPAQCCLDLSCSRRRAWALPSGVAAGETAGEVATSAKDAGKCRVRARSASRGVPYGDSETGVGGWPAFCARRARRRAGDSLSSEKGDGIAAYSLARPWERLVRVRPRPSCAFGNQIFLNTCQFFAFRISNWPVSWTMIVTGMQAKRTHMQTRGHGLTLPGIAQRNVLIPLPRGPSRTASRRTARRAAPRRRAPPAVPARAVCAAASP